MTAPRRPVGRPKVRVVLPDGRTVYGRQEAAQALGRRTATALFERYGEQRDGVWYLRAAGEGRDPRLLRIELPGGRTVDGWDAAAAALGVSRNTAKRRAVRAGEGRYRVVGSGGRRRSTITLWDGRACAGWRAAAEATGETEAALRWRAVPTAGGYSVAAPPPRRRSRRGWYTNGAVKKRGE